MAKPIDRRLDREHLAEELGCRVCDHAGDVKKFTSDEDLRKFFSYEDHVLIEASFRDGEYTIRWAFLPEQKAPTKKVVKKKKVKS